MNRSSSSSTSSSNLHAGTQPTLPSPQDPANPNDPGTNNHQPRMHQNQRQTGTESDHRTSQPKNALQEHHRNLLDSLDYQLREVKPPLANKLPSILSLCDSLKKSERDLAKLLQKHAQHPSVVRLRSKLIAFAHHLSKALNSRDATTHLAPLKHEEVQAICLGLSVCVPASGPRLFDPSLDTDDRDTLQTLTDTLLKQAMRKGLPDGVDANGQVFDILNLVSRLLKAELITADDVISQCFGKVLVLIDAWTGGDQCQRLISDHNLGRCAVQVATIINYELLELDEPIATTSSREQPATQGQLLQQCVLKLCSDAVLSRLATAPVDAVSLLNVCNTLKDALDKRVLHPNSPTLLPALDRLTKVIGSLPQAALAGDEADYVPLANFSNFLRKIGEYRIQKKQVFQDALPAMEQACSHLIGCINHSDFDGTIADGQALSNLVSFVKYCDKQRSAKSAPTSTASAYSPSSSSSSSSASSSTTAPPDQRALQNAASSLVSALLAKGSQCLHHPKSLAGAVIGLAYLWASNLVPRSPALKAWMGVLLKQVAPTPGTHWPYNPRIILPALKLMLDAGMVSAKDLWLPAQEIDRRIGELGAIVETIDALPPLPLPATAPSTATAASKAAPKPANPIGMTAVVETPLLGVFTPPPSGSTLPVNKSTSTVTEDRKPKKTFKGRQASADLVHSTPVLIGKSPKKKQETVTANAANPKTEKAPQDKSVRSPGNKKNHAPKKNNDAAQPAKAKRKPDSRSALDPIQRALCKAIVDGNAKQVDVQLKASGQWTEERIVAVLDQLQQDLLMVGKNEVAALDRFLTKILSLLPQEAEEILTTFYSENTPTSSAVLLLLKNRDLIIDFQSLCSASMVLNFIEYSSEPKWNVFLKVKRGRELLEGELFAEKNILAFAITQNRMPALDRMLQTPIGQSMVTQKDSRGDSLLNLAILSTNTEAAKKLLQLPSANEQALMTSSGGGIPLMFAALDNRTDLVDMLLALPSANEQATAQDTDGRNALMLAIKQGHADCAARLLSHRTAGVQSLSKNVKGLNPLMIAAKRGERDIVKNLLELLTANLQAIAQTKEGMNALMYAVEVDVDIVRMLLQIESTNEQVLAVDKNGKSALQRATIGDHVDAAELLLSVSSAEEAINMLDNYGINLMALALSRYPKIVELLLRFPIANKLINECAKADLNPLHISIKNKDVDIANKMLSLPSADSQVRAALEAGNNVLTLALENGLVDVAVKLLSLPSANDQALLINNPNNISPLLIAADRGYLSIVRLLLGLPSADQQSLAKSKQGMNPLMAATRRNHNEITGELLKLPTAEIQIDALASNPSAFNPPSEAFHLEAVKLLKQAMVIAQLANT